MEEKPLGENVVNGDSETMTRNEEEAKENSSQSQSLDINPNEESQDSIPSGLQAEESSTQSPSEYQFYEEELQQGQHNFSSDLDNAMKLQEIVQKEFREFRKVIDPELDKLKDCSTRDELSAAVKKFYSFIDQKLDECNFSHEAFRKQVDFYVNHTIDWMEAQLFHH
jgi:hypothetical protein